MKLAIELYIMVATAAIPFAVAFGIGNLILSMLFKAAFGGKLEFKI